MTNRESFYPRSETQLRSLEWDAANQETLEALRTYLQLREKQLNIIELAQGQVRQLKGEFSNIIFLGSAAQYDPLQDRNGKLANALPPDRYVVQNIELIPSEQPEVLLVPQINLTGIAYRVHGGRVHEALDEEIDYGGTDMHPSLAQVLAWQEENIHSHHIARD